jgi:hypothetical protein
MSCVKFCVQVCPLLLQILHERIEFPLFVRIMRAFTTLLRDFGHVLIKQCEPLLGALLHCLASSAASNLELAHSGFEDGVGASAGERVRPILISLSLPSFFFFFFFFRLNLIIFASQPFQQQNCLCVFFLFRFLL